MPHTPDASNKLNIGVRDSDGSEVCFVVKRSTRFAKIKAAFAENRGRDMGEIRMRFDGEAVGSHQTPADLEMEDGDIIENPLERGFTLPSVARLANA